MLRQFAHVFAERGYYGRRVPARDLEKHRKASMAFDERHDVRVVCPERRSPSPVTWHGTVIDIGGRSRMETVSTIRPVPLFVVPPFADAFAAL